LKYITWNCNGAFRKKFERIESFDADVLIIQECEDPARSKDSKYTDWARNYLWIGENKNKGLGVFAKETVRLTPLEWSNQYEDHHVNYFLPCLINEEHQLLAIWAHHNNSPTFGYIGQLWKYLQINFTQFDNILIAGDLNSNVIWDKWDRWWNHSDVLKIFETKGIQSLYHKYNCEEQGKELTPTFYLQRKMDKPYHIDYFFGSQNFQSNFELLVADFEQWLGVSDHMPVILNRQVL
jgi:exonuclease III